MAITINRFPYGAYASFLTRNANRFRYCGEVETLLRHWTDLNKSIIAGWIESRPNSDGPTIRTAKTAYDTMRDIESAIVNGTVLLDSLTGEVIEDDDYVVSADDFVILRADTVNNSQEYFMCAHCGKVYRSTDEYRTMYDYVDGEIWCTSCLDMDAWFCDGCNEYHNEYTTGRYPTRSGWHTYCRDYVNAHDEYLHICPECEYVITDDDEWNSREGTCIYCNPKKSAIKNYHDRPELRFYGKRNKKRSSVASGPAWARSIACEHIGFELEIDDGTDPESAAEYIYDELGDLVYFNHDGSLSSDGFEIITQPMTFDYTYNNFMPKLDRVFDELVHSWDYRSHNTDTCGLHAHISRDYFGSNPYKRNLALRKMILFYEDFYSDVLRVSRRQRDQAEEWAAPYEIDTYEDAKAIAEDRHGSRYHCVNLTNRDTVEIRIMRGTLNPDTFRACADFIMTIAKNSRRVKLSDRYNLSAWLKGLKPETLEYLKRRGAFPAYTVTV